MNIVDAVILLIILLCTVLGLKKGVIKSLVQLIGTTAVLILAYAFKDVLANFLMKNLPFFNFVGFEGITSMNILVYEMLSFVVIFVLMYCVLNIVISLSGLIEKLLEITVVLAIPSKILGAIVGFLEGVILAFVVTFIMLHIGPTTNYVRESNFGVILLERTPFMGPVMAKTTLALEEITEIVANLDENEDRKSANAQVLQILVHYQIITKEDATKLIEDGKLDLGNVTFA